MDRFPIVDYRLVSGIIQPWSDIANTTRSLVENSQVTEPRRRGPIKRTTKNSVTLRLAKVDWLNEITGDKFSFFGLEMELWRIGDSPVAPKFNMVSKPNDWTKGGYPKRTGELTGHQQLQLELWTAFKEYMTEHKSDIKCAKPQPQSWMWHPIGRAGIRLASITSIWDSEAGVGDPEVRVELTLDDDNSDVYFEALRKQKAEIEQEIGRPLTWYASKGRTRRIYLRKKIEFRDRAKWSEVFEWLRQNQELFYRVFGPRVKTLKGGDEA